MLIDRENSALLVIDIQERLNPVMHSPEMVVENTIRLIRGAELLGVVMMVSEQYPKGLGHTVGDIAAAVSPMVVVEKSAFSCMADEQYVKKFEQLGKRQAVIAGIEAHVCVLQTSLELVERGIEVFVVSDATSSRTEANHRAGLERIKDAGGKIVTTEMVLFEWLRRAGTPEFREISALVK